VGDCKIPTLLALHSQIKHLAYPTNMFSLQCILCYVIPTGIPKWKVQVGP